LATFEVVGVRKERATVLGRDHEHIVGVITRDGGFHPNQEVVDSLAAGHQWVTAPKGAPQARIRPLVYCPSVACLYRPYLTTAPDHQEQNDLEQLPRG
jgi:hypothetical protein